MKGQDLTRVRDMVRELNKMLEQRMEGRTPDFNGFMERFADRAGAATASRAGSANNSESSRCGGASRPGGIAAKDVLLGR